MVGLCTVPSALRVREVVRGLSGAGRRVKVVVGGAPFLLDPELWREVGADAMGRTASDAAGIVATMNREAA